MSKFKNFVNKLLTAATGAKRAMGQIAQKGNLDDFKLFDNLTAEERRAQAKGGGKLILGAVLGGQGLNNLGENMLGNKNNPLQGIGGLSGGITIGGESTKNTFLPFVIVGAIVVTMIALFAIFKPKSRRR
jgi:hypothetical protein